VRLGEHVSALSWARGSDTAVAATLDGHVQAIALGSPDPPRLLAEHAGGALSVDISADHVVATGGQDGFLRLVRLADGRLVAAREGGGSWVEHVRWSPNGRWLASAAGRIVRFWKRDGVAAGEFRGHPGAVTAMWWDGSSETLTTASSDGLRLLRPRRRRALVHIPWDSAGTVLAAVESSDERYIAMAHLGGTVSVLQVNTSRSIQYGGFPAKIRQLVWSPDSRRLAVASGETVPVFGFTPRAPDRQRARVLRVQHGRVLALTFIAAPGGTLLASGCESGRILLWAQARDFRRVGALRLAAPIEHLFASTAGRHLAVASRGGDLQIYSLAA
jgi:WD40 repeat protein